MERLGSNLDWMNGKSAMINGMIGTAKYCGPPDACFRMTFNEGESTSVPAAEAAKGVLSLIASRLPVTFWPDDQPARLSAEARLGRQAGGRSATSVESGKGGTHLLAAETASRTLPEKALPSGDNPVDSATKSTTLGQARVRASVAAGAPSARHYSDNGNAADWRLGVDREERVEMLNKVFPYVSNKVGDKMSRECKVNVTKCLEDCEFCPIAYSLLCTQSCPPKT